jgi:translation initiation factor 5A
MDSPETVADAGASLTVPQNVGKLKKGDYVLIAKSPCKIANITFFKTGKHGHAKTHIVGYDIFTHKRVEMGGLSTAHNVDVPVVTRDEYQLVGVHDGYASLLDQATGDLTSLPIPPPAELRRNTEDESAAFARLIATLDTSDSEIMVTVQRAMGRTAIIV